MGRSEPTFRWLLDRIEAEWGEYKRGLRREDAHAFETLFRRVRAHASSCSNVARVDAMESVFMSVLLEHEREIERLKAEVARLRDPSDGGA